VPLDCTIPNDATFEQNWDCRLSGLPDLDQRQPFVRQELANWIKWFLAQFSRWLQSSWTVGQTLYAGEQRGCWGRLAEACLLH
jgi:hypothetical protein